jgi:hypothetical protein
LKVLASLSAFVVFVFHLNNTPITLMEIHMSMDAIRIYNPRILREMGNVSATKKRKPAL